MNSDPQTTPTSQTAVRKPYSKPELRSLGSVSSMTAGGFDSTGKRPKPHG